MSFNIGFKKISASFSSGLSEAAKQTVGDTLKLKGVRDAFKDIRKVYKGRMKDLYKTEFGRADLAHATAKSLPSLAVAATYGAIANKVRNKMKEKEQQANQMQYYQQ